MKPSRFQSHSIIFTLKAKDKWQMVTIASQVTRSQVSTFRMIATITLILFHQEGQITHITLNRASCHRRTAKYMIETAPFTMPTICGLCTMSARCLLRNLR